jgi:type IV pilus assembly protein PilC
LILTPGQLAAQSQFYHQIGGLLGAGVTLMEALQVVAHSPPGRSFRDLAAQLHQALEGGATFHEALSRLGRRVPAFDTALLQAGELSGRLEACFKLLAGYYEERARLLRSLLGDLAYPAFLGHVAVFLFPFPQFVLSGNVGAYARQTVGLLAPLYLAIFALILACQGRHGETWRGVIEAIFHPVPLLGRGRRCLALARLAAALEALINAGVLILPAWELAAAASGSPALRRAVRAWRPRLERGETPGELLQRTPAFPEVFANLYRSAELSGQLDDTLRRLREFYQDEASRRLKALSRWTPQVIYLAVMLGIGWKIVSFYLGYFGRLNEVLKF